MSSQLGAQLGGRIAVSVVLALICVEQAACSVAPPSQGTTNITFSDVTGQEGLTDEVTKDRWGHGVAWGDVNNDESLDLLLGTFADYHSLVQQGYTSGTFKPDQLAMGSAIGFTTAPDSVFPQTYGWTSGLTFADLDNDGDKDLVLSRNQEDKYDQETTPGETIALRNNADSFEIVSDAIPDNERHKVGGRSITVLDYNADGLLDLFISQDRFAGGRSSLLGNTGDFRFVDATQSAGLPTDIEGYGVSAKDLTGDGRGDLYVVGSNRLFIAEGSGTFREVDAKAAGLVRPAPDSSRPRDDFDTGVSVGDVNRDGRPDVAIAHHYASAANLGRKLPPVSLYLNRGLSNNGDPAFEDVTEKAGLPSVAARSADVNINDYDNDGCLDVFYDFFFSNVDGQLLLRNETESGHWLSLSVGQALGGGVGATVSVYSSGGLGDPKALIGQREIAATDGYTAGVPDEAHFGLGANTNVDVRVTLPPGSQGKVVNGVIELRDVPADCRLQLPQGCQ